MPVNYSANTLLARNGYRQFDSTEYGLPYFQKLPRNDAVHQPWKHCAFSCNEVLNYDLLNFDMDEYSESELKKKLSDIETDEVVYKRGADAVKSASVYCRELQFENNYDSGKLVEKTGPLYDIYPFGQSYEIANQSLNKVVVPSAFLPGLPNQVLFVDIRDGQPYQGTIEIEQISPSSESHDGAKSFQIDGAGSVKTDNPGGSPRFAITADESGVTSFLLTIHEKTKLRFKAGDKIYESAFSPNRLPFHAEVTGRDLAYATIRIDFRDEPTDMVVDYFVGNTWTERQKIPKPGTRSAQLKLLPNFQYKRGTRSWNDQFDIVYVRLSKSGFPIDKSYQTFALFASSEPYEDRFKIGAIYQDFVKLHYLKLGKQDEAKNAASQIYDLYHEPEAQLKSWCADMFAVAPVLLSDRNMTAETRSRTANGMGRRQLSIRDHNIETYLLSRLALEHRPKAVSVPFDDNPKTHGRHIAAVVSLMILLFGGVLVFMYIAARMRDAQQRAWYDTVANMGSRSRKPHIPQYFVIIIIFLLIGYLAVTNYMLTLWNPFE
ncbi:MAG: hypothetical protein IJM59_09100 [Proteobacteria bacterium]|nr:hypothetical protein [Pseudomonadota bacterium]